MTDQERQTQEFHIDIMTDDKTALDYLAEASGLSRQKLKAAMQKGCVWLEQNRGGKIEHTSIARLRRAKKILTIGNVLHFYFDEKILEQVPQSAALVSDEGDYSIWNKPTGMFSQGSKWGDHCTIQRWAEKHLVPQRVSFVVHRLDRAANGLIILAHKKKVAAQFGRLFEQKKINKIYQVLVEGCFADVCFEIKPEIKAEKGKQDSITIDTELDGKHSVSHVRLLNFDEKNNQSLLEVVIETGRKHQIRKHLSGIGLPVVGDRLYGVKEQSPESLPQQQIDLHLSAVALSFICPVSQVEKSYTL